ncbi:hypothetical protein ACS0TY_014640 [Phlomoides rotata]
MAIIYRFLSLPLFFFSLLFIALPVLSTTSPAPSPSLPPLPPADGTSQPPATPSSAPAPSFSSPPAPPPSDLAPKSHTPTPTPQENNNESPSPAPAVSGDVKHVNQPNAGNIETEEKSSGGMSRGQKASVAIGVIAGACVVGVGALVYKKRQQNIQRSQYGYAARREIL